MDRVGRRGPCASGQRTRLANKPDTTSKAHCRKPRARRPGTSAPTNGANQNLSLPKRRFDPESVARRPSFGSFRAQVSGPDFATRFRQQVKKGVAVQVFLSAPERIRTSDLRFRSSQPSSSGASRTTIRLPRRLRSKRLPFGSRDPARERSTPPAVGRSSWRRRELRSPRALTVPLVHREQRPSSKSALAESGSGEVARSDDCFRRGAIALGLRALAIALDDEKQGAVARCVRPYPSDCRGRTPSPGRVFRMVRCAGS